MNSVVPSSIHIHHLETADIPVVTGCPFSVSAIPEGVSSAEIRFPGGQTARAQLTALTPPLPGGARWMELSFMTPADGSAEVRLFPEAEPSDWQDNVASEDGAVLDNGQVRVEIRSDPGQAPLHISWKDGTGALQPECFVDGGPIRDAPDRRRAIRVTRNGPLRCRVEVSGQGVDATGAPSLGYRLAVELWRDVPALRVDWMLIHEMPGKPEVKVSRAVLAGEWDLGEGSAERVFLQPHHTNEYLPRLVRNPDPVTILADTTRWAAHVADFAMLRDTAVYNHYCLPSAPVAAPWLQLHGAAGTVCATLKDFIESRPNAFHSAGNRLDYQMIPDGAELAWPQGRRREQSLLLAFGAAEGDPRALAGVAESVFAPGRAVPAPETLAALRCFDLDRMLAGSGGGHVRMNRLLDQFCHLVTPSGKWDLGDTPNWHYSLGYGSERNPCWMAEDPVGMPPKRFRATGGLLFPDAVAGFIEPVWTNNEYDMIHALAAEIMRTGRNTHFNMLRWAARHNIEVDFLVYADDPRHHRGTPFHSHFHNTKGCITSHIWTQGLLEYYCLTGDDDARDTALALGDKIVEINHSGAAANWKFDREIGWALLALVCLAEAGHDRFRKEAARIADFFRAYDRKAFNQRVNLSGSTAGRSLARQMIDCGFGYASLVEALEKHDRLTGDRAFGAWFDDLLRELKNECWNKVAEGELPTVHNMVPHIMAIGYDRLGDVDFLNAGEVSLEHYLDPAFPEKHPLGGENGESKPSAMSHRALCRFCGAMARAGRLDRFEYPGIRSGSERLTT